MTCFLTAIIANVVVILVDARQNDSVFFGGRPFDERIIKHTAGCESRQKKNEH
jgi:hypothetical protein